jgi:hypothetical protein
MKGGAPPIKNILLEYGLDIKQVHQKESVMLEHEAFPGRYIKSADVKEKPIIAKIKNLSRESVGQGLDQEMKWLLILENQKPLVLNRTNWKSLEDAFGDSDNWYGRKIRLYCDQTRFGNKKVDCVRIEPLDHIAPSDGDE